MPSQRSSGRSGISKKPTSARSTRSAPTCFASGRSKPPWIRSSSCSTTPRRERLYDDVFHAWLHGQLLSPREGVRRSLRRPARRNFGRDVDEDGPVQRLRQAGWTLLQWRDHPAPWTRDPDWDRERAVGALLEAVEIVGAMSDRASWREDPVFKNLEAVRAAADEIRRARAGGPARLRRLGIAADRSGEEPRHHQAQGRPPAYAQGISREQILAARAELVERSTAFQLAADADLAAKLHDDLADRSSGTGRRSRGRARSIFSTCWSARAICSATTRRFASAFRDGSAPVRRRVSGHRPAAGGVARAAGG